MPFTLANVVTRDPAVGLTGLARGLRHHGHDGVDNRWFNPNDSPLVARQIGAAFADMVLGGLAVAS
jgi:hypothetical protein